MCLEHMCRHINIYSNLYLDMGDIIMQEIRIQTSAQIYDFSELQERKQQREFRRKKPFYITGIILLISLFIMFIFLCFGNRIVTAKEPVSEIQYKVIEVAEGDSLWSIARENLASEANQAGFTDIYQYVHEIKKCNNLKSDQINAGCYLMIPYYTLITPTCAKVLK